MNPLDIKLKGAKYDSLEELFSAVMKVANTDGHPEQVYACKMMSEIWTKFAKSTGTWGKGLGESFADQYDEKARKLKKAKEKVKFT